MKEKNAVRSTIFLCDEHKKSLEQHYYLDELEREDRWGTCFGCMKKAIGRAYAFEPRRRQYRRAGSGGGERARAGR